MPGPCLGTKAFAGSPDKALVNINNRDAYDEWKKRSRIAFFECLPPSRMGARAHPRPLRFRFSVERGPVSDEGFVALPLVTHTHIDQHTTLSNAAHLSYGKNV